MNSEHANYAECTLVGAEDRRHYEEIVRYDFTEKAFSCMSAFLINQKPHVNDRILESTWLGLDDNGNEPKQRASADERARLLMLTIPESQDLFNKKVTSNATFELNDGTLLL